MVETATRLGRGADQAREHAEGVVARMIEDRTARLPSDLWLWAAFASIGLSLGLQLKGKQHESGDKHRIPE